MRYLFLLSLVGLLGCSKHEPSKRVCTPGTPFQGEWITEISPEITSILNLSSDCIGTESTCGIRFNYDDPVDDKVFINVTDRNFQDGCLSLGSYNCSFNYTDNNLVGEEELIIGCNGITTTYKR